MLRSHEQSIIDSFFDYFKMVVEDRGENLTRFSTDGQDSILGGDYIFTNSTKFVLTEFKYKEKGIKLEGKKERMLTLCIELDKDERRLNQSINCHYIGWSHLQSDLTILFNSYYNEVCNKKIFEQSSGLEQCGPKKERRITAEKFVNEFLDGNIGVTYKNFDHYVKWLTGLGGSGTSSIELITRDPTSKVMRMLEFSSISALKDWLDMIKPQQAKQNKPGGSFHP